MALQPVARRSVPDEVFDQIIDDVVSGEFAPGESLPSERKLAEVLGVSRPAVREALQRVAQAGLVEVRQGDATTVRDYKRFASLDLLPRLLLPRGEIDPAVARSVLEARLLIGPKMAAMAAERAATRIGAQLREAVTALETDDDPVNRQRHALAFWDHIVEGADSIVFRLMFNSLRASYEPALAALATMMEAEVGQVEIYRAVADAIVAGDAEGARRAAEELLTPATNALLAAIRKLEEMP
jgi:GntR family transcriptional repressor for pyruvate dehydrogenase complex